MSATFAEPASDFRPHPILAMAAWFWVFSYALLTVRGALFYDDWSRFIDDNRLLAVTIGAAAYALVLAKLRGGRRPTLSGVISCVALATVAIMIVRVSMDRLMFEVPHSLEVHLLWSLSWSAYFSLWVMGSIAFETESAMGRSLAPARPEGRTIAAAAREARAKPISKPNEVDSIALLIDAIALEVAELESCERDELADNLLRLGGYEMAGNDPWARSQSARARFVIGLAARLKRSEP